MSQFEALPERLVVAPRAQRRFALSLVRRGALLAFLGILAVFAFTAPGFLSVGNVANVLAQSAIPGLLAFGLTCVVIGGGPNVLSGGLDLSVAANLGLCAAVYCRLNNAGVQSWVAIGLTLSCGLGVGLLNGLTVVVLRLPALLATLASMNLIAGLELVLTENTVLPTESALLDTLSSAVWLGLPALAWVLLATTLLLSLLIQHSAYGLRLHAVGEYPEAARGAGLAIERYVLSSYLLSGLCGALAAFCSVAFFSGSTTGSSEMLLSVVAITFLGVVFSRRLVANISGTFIATLLIGFLINGFQLLNISSFWVNGVQGVLILLVVAAASALNKEPGL